MAKRLQHRGGTTAQHSTFTGAVREVTVDTDKNTLVVHDGATAGGHPLATATNFTSTGIDDNATSTAITINSSENVLVGDTSVTDASSSARVYSKTGYGIITNNNENAGGIKLSSSLTNALIFQADPNNQRADTQMYFYTDGSERMKIDTSYNLLVGGSNVTDASSSAKVYSKTGFGIITNFNENAGGIKLSSSSQNSVIVYSDPNNQRADSFVGFNVDGSERMRIDSSGNVGIGTTTTRTNALLNVNGGINSETGLIGRALNDTFTLNGQTQPNYGANFSASVGIPSGISGYRGLAFATNSSERMRIDSSGNVMVGKTSLSSSTDGVEARANGELNASKTSGIVFSLNRNTTDGTIAVFKKAGTTVGTIGTKSSKPYFASTGSGATGITFGSDKLILSNQDGVIQDNSRDIGSSSERIKDIYLGGGLYVGGTGTANKLDDYEEGTWTPSFSDAGGGSYQYSTQLGNYTKIGNTVFISGILITGGTFRTGGSGNVLLNGLPFAVSGGFGGIQTLHSYGTWVNVPLGAEIAGTGTTSNIFYRDTADGIRQRLQASDISTSYFVYMAFAGFYKTA